MTRPELLFAGEADYTCYVNQRGRGKGRGMGGRKTWAEVRAPVSPAQSTTCQARGAGDFCLGTGKSASRLRLGVPPQPAALAPPSPGGRHITWPSSTGR